MTNSALGSSLAQTQQTSLFNLLRLLSHEMAPMKTKASAKPMTKGAIAEELATACELKKAQCAKIIDSFAEIATKEVSKTGVFKLPGVVQIKTRMKPATKAGEREVFGKVVMVKAKPAKKVVKAFPLAALKKSV